jgi:CRISPR system Cascade subunit CasD
MDCLMLRLDAPLMSFGGVVVDQINPIERFPGRSLLTGLAGNALGWDHRDKEKLDRLQARIRYAARWDLEPARIIDYQTVDLGQAHMKGAGWTTRGHAEERKGGEAAEMTHQRYRHYWANGCATIALALTDEAVPDLAAIEAALRHPARPLFIGRKCCLPSTPILLGRRAAASLREALIAEPLADNRQRKRLDRIEAMWPIDEGMGAQTREIYDLRDWQNNLHRGTERYAVGFLEISHG